MMTNTMRIVLRSIAWTALAALALSIWPASAGTVYGIRIVEQGEFDCPRPDSYRPSETGGTQTWSRGSCRLVTATQYVKAAIGKNYGCAYEVLGSPDGEGVTLEHRIIIPDPGVVNPTTGVHFLTTSSTNNTHIGAKRAIAAWRPDTSGELVAGDWTFEIRYQGRLMASCVIHVST